jgi:hypothetical protein
MRFSISVANLNDTGCGFIKGDSNLSRCYASFLKPNLSEIFLPAFITFGIRSIVFGLMRAVAPVMVSFALHSQVISRLAASAERSVWDTPNDVSGQQDRALFS